MSNHTAPYCGFKFTWVFTGNKENYGFQKEFLEKTTLYKQSHIIYFWDLSTYEEKGCHLDLMNGQKNHHGTTVLNKYNHGAFSSKFFNNTNAI